MQLMIHARLLRGQQDWVLRIVLWGKLPHGVKLHHFTWQYIVDPLQMRGRLIDFVMFNSKCWCVCLLKLANFPVLLRMYCCPCVSRYALLSTYFPA